MMKTIISMLLVCVLLLSACSPAVNQPFDTTADVEQTTTASDLTDSQIYDEFLALLSNRLARIIIDDTLLDGFGLKEGMAGIAEIAYLRELDMLDKIGYAILDINDDGTSELLILDIRKSVDNDIDTNGILCAYTVSGNVSVLLAEGSSQNRYYLLDDGTILNCNIVDTAVQSVGVYRLDSNGTVLVCLDYYFAADDGNGQQIWYQNQTGAQDVAASVAVPGGVDDFKAIQDELAYRIQTVETIPFSAIVE